MTLGEDKSVLGSFHYECPDCSHRRYSTPTSKEQYYKQFKDILK